MLTNVAQLLLPFYNKIRDLEKKNMYFYCIEVYTSQELSMTSALNTVVHKINYAYMNKSTQ